MKTQCLIALALACSGSSWLGASSAYTNFIRQVQLPSGVVWDASVPSAGVQDSPLTVDEGGARFELWTVLSTPLTTYLLDTRYVSSYTPAAEVVILSEDPYQAIPRTRADRPFQVQVTVAGLLEGEAVPAASKAVKLLRHTQSYGDGGIGEDLDRSAAALCSQVMLNQNGTQTLSFEMNSVPAADRSKVRGEERFSVFSIADSRSPESQIASKSIQIWPVAEASVHGISEDQKIRLQLPKITLTLKDLYPESRTYAQVYRGEARLGVEGTMVPGTCLILNGSVPESRVLVLDRYDSVFEEDGTWTLEVLTVTPFGIDRMAHVTFEIDRVVSVNSVLTTME
jgi:hypothetical protein